MSGNSDTLTRNLRPASREELCGLVKDAMSSGERLQIRGGGTKDLVGAPSHNATTVDMCGFSGITAYEPAELVLTAGAGTPLALIAAAVEAEGQMLAFDPFDHTALFGGSGEATIGGVIAANVSGSRRLSRGAARDHLLGFTAVSGRGELFVAGGRVVKNVTGYDLPKVVAGSWGRLAALVEVTVKVLPRPRAARTLRVGGLDADRAVKLMAHAVGTSMDITAARHLPEPLGLNMTGSEAAVTEFLIEGFPDSVDVRCNHLVRFVGDTVGDAPADLVEADAGAWNAVVPVAVMPSDLPLWRVNILPTRAADCIRQLQPLAPVWWMDWAGGLLWVSVEDRTAKVREIATSLGGHAMLLRAPVEVRRSVAAMASPSAALAALETRVRRAFDPAGLFETGRF